MVRGLLERVCDSEQRRFREGSAEELHANGKAAGRESRRNVYGGKSTVGRNTRIAPYLIVSEHRRDPARDRVGQHIQVVVVHQAGKSGGERPTRRQVIAIVVAAQIVLWLTPDG